MIKKDPTTLRMSLPTLQDYQKIDPKKASKIKKMLEEARMFNYYKFLMAAEEVTNKPQLTISIDVYTDRVWYKPWTWIRRKVDWQKDVEKYS